MRMTRQHYLPVATRGAIIYFTLVDLPSLNVMYQFSLQWFVNIFTGCLLKETGATNDDQKRANSPLLGTLQAGSCHMECCGFMKMKLFHRLVILSSRDITNLLAKHFQQLLKVQQGKGKMKN